MIGLKDQCFGVEVEMTGITGARELFWNYTPVQRRDL